MPMQDAHSSVRPGIVIVGGGLVGLACAAALADAAATYCPITVVDPVFASGSRPDARASALTPGSRHLLEALGVWEEIAPLAQSVHAMDITDARMEQLLRPVFLSFAQSEEGQPLAHIVPNDAVHQALLARVSKADVTLLATTVNRVQVTEGMAELHLADGSMLAAQLVVAADGGQSPLRKQAGIADFGWRYDRTAMVTTIAHTVPHEGRATQHFLEGGPFALLPLTGNRSSIVWTEPHATAQALMALPDGDFCAELAQRAGTALGDITLAGKRASHPLALRMARRLIGPRLALIGDAAHGMHPVAGQGVNLGFRDVAALVETVSDALALGGDCGREHVLRRYERWRHFDTVMMLAATDSLVRLFHARAMPLRFIRDVGLGVVDRMPWLKGAIMRAASGATPEAPRLLRRQPCSGEQI